MTETNKWTARWILLDLVKQDTLTDEQANWYHDAMWLRPALQGGLVPAVMRITEKHLHIFREDYHTPEMVALGMYERGEITPLAQLIYVKTEFLVGETMSPERAERRLIKLAYREYENRMFKTPYLHSMIHSGIPQGHTVINGLMASWHDWNGVQGFDAKSFEHGYVEDHRTEYRIESIEPAEDNDIDLISSFCPHCLHHAVGECMSDSDFLHCSHCDTLIEVVE
jgi:hypothetical protein